MKQITDSNMVWRFFNDRLGLQDSADFRGVCHFLDEQSQRGAPITMDAVSAAVAFNNFVGRTCCMHVVVQRREGVTISGIRDAFEFAFLDAGCEAILGLVDADNEAIVDIARRFGFTQIATVPNGGLNSDLLVLRMLRSECRWLRKH